jgi:leucyl-tRNA---protein transferase
MRLVDDSFSHRSVTPEQMDKLWALGWRHFGAHFFRYSVASHAGEDRLAIPLRIDLARFSLSLSQKRVLARNHQAKIVVRDTVIDQVKGRLFSRHRVRFKENVPESIYDFFSEDPARVPCLNREICVYEGDRLIAASFFDLGSEATSAVYAMFDPAESKRSLGIFTMLEEIRYSQQLGCRYYYPGYTYHESSICDYKKNFAALEYLDWDTGWRPYHKT